MRSASDLRRAAYYRLFSADGYLGGLSRSASLLDVGCSDGRGSETLSRRRRTASTSTDRLSGAHAETGGGPGSCRPTCAAFRTGTARYDAVIALDVVEHFTKPDALDVIAELERVAGQLVVIATPRGFLPQPGTAEEPWQEHRCGFEVDELEASGYRVEALGGPKWLRGDYGAFRVGPLGQLAVLLTKPIVPPSAAFALLAAKRVRLSTPSALSQGVGTLAACLAFELVSDFAPAGDQPEAIDRARRRRRAGRAVPDAARHHRLGEVASRSPA